MQEHATTPPPAVPRGVGLIVIGSEILDGRVRDRHAKTCRTLLQERHLRQPYTLILEDNAELIEAQLRWAMARPEPFFCCGGIGATPDDVTRQCAARAAGTDIALHAEAVAILRNRYGKEATPGRLRMVEFPAGSTLIPNPVNQVPGFTLRNGHFLPGFPQMAAPMMAWVLDTYYARGSESIRHELVLPGAREGDLIDLMNAFAAAHPELVFSSLPRFTAQGTEIALAVYGPVEQAARGLLDLTALLDTAGVLYEQSRAGHKRAAPDE